MKNCFAICILLPLAATLLGGCTKSFLNKQPSTALVVPSTLTDFQALLDNDKVMSGTPVLGELSADNFYLTYAFWQSIDLREQNAYVWAPDIYQGQGKVEDWDAPYQQVFYANEVLEGLAGIGVTASNRQQWENEQGMALFCRAYAFFNVAQLFAAVYDSSTADNSPGIPLRLHSDVSAPSVRASVQQTYGQILNDLEQASSLLPQEIQTANRNRPCRPAAQAMLARVYLSMGAYAFAGSHADSCLQLYDSLIDYNAIPSQAVLPFTRLNIETLYQSSFLPYTQVLAGIVYTGCVVDSGLYRSYATGDLRQSVFYELNGAGLPNLKGSYSGTIYPFSGLATDEAYLIRAECAARAGRTAPALDDLNTLLRRRYQPGTFTPLTAASPAEALDLVLSERRKELAFRGLRWTDLRRLNKEGRNITPARSINNIPYTLLPNSSLYTLPIPPDVLSFNPGMPQNKR